MHSLRTAVALGLALIVGLLPAQGLSAQGSDERVPGEPTWNISPLRPSGERVPVFISFRQQPGPAEEALVRQTGGTIKYTYRRVVPAIAATVPDTAIRGLLANPRVTRVERDIETRIVDHTTTSGDDELNNTWGVKHIGAGAVHAGNKGTGVKVAILDTGIDTNHPDLVYDASCSSGTSYPSIEDGHGHGTHVAGTIAARDNSIGVVGVAPEATVCVYKVLSDSGSGSYSDVVQALDLVASYNATNPPIRATNNSYGSSGDPGQTVKQAFDNLYAAGVLHVAAAGNSGNPKGNGSNCIYPARWDSLIATAATDANDKRASWSSTCPELELSAPGVSIKSTTKNGGYGNMSGTSMASPHGAGTAALVLAANPGWTNTQIRNKLTGTADDLGDPGRDSKYGYGLVDADEAAASTNLAITNLSASPNPFSPNGDGVKDTTAISFSLNKAAAWSISVSNRTFTGSTAGASTVSVIWDGKNTSGTVVADGSPVSATATSGSETASASTSVTVDTTPPVVSNIPASSITASSAEITWGTDEASDSRGEYGTTSGSYANSVYDGKLVTAHKVSLTGLSALTTYYYRVTFLDAAGNTGVSGEQSFKTADGSSKVVFSDNFEGGAINWSASRLWHLATDTGCVSPGHTSATHSFYYGQATCNYNTGIANSGTLTSPTIGGLVAGDSTAVLSFNYWREVEFYKQGQFDKTYVQVSYDGGSTWTTVWSKSSRDASEKQWTLASVSLSPNSTSASVRFVFDTVDGVENGYRGWLIDDVKVENK